jgi:hypothetical protein
MVDVAILLEIKMAHSVQYVVLGRKALSAGILSIDTTRIHSLNAVSQLQRLSRSMARVENGGT